MKTTSIIIGFILICAASANADVRDDYRSCEQNFLSRLPRGVEPEANSAEQEYCLGLGYWFHEPQSRLQRDPVKSAHWFAVASNHGSRQAQVTLGYQYEKGVGVTQDFAKAAELYRVAADKGDASGMFNLGRLYTLGRGVPKDDQEADKWFRLAASHGSAEAKVHFRNSDQYNRLESSARDVYQNAVRSYVAKDFSKAATLFRQASDVGNVSAKVALGQLYRQGIGVPKDLKTATELYREAALLGHASAQAQLGLSYELGEGVPENWAEAIEWYKKSALQLHPLGLFSMGRAYQFGIGVPQDRQIAVRIFEKAQNEGEQQAGFFAKWLRNPANCLGYLSDAEREKFAGLCSDPKGITFHSSAERRAWLVKTMASVQVNFFGSTSYEQGACGAIGGDFRGGNCFGFGGAILDPYSSQNRFGQNQW